jgi:hypothetical protein
LKQNGLHKDLDCKNTWQILLIMCFGTTRNPYAEQLFPPIFGAMKDVLYIQTTLIKQNLIFVISQQKNIATKT